MLLDDENIVRETPPTPTVTPGAYSKNLICQLSVNLKTGPMILI